MIQTRNLTKIYHEEGVETVALRQVNLTVSEGEFISIMGPSGCGKSTLLILLGLVDTPSGGEYFFLGSDVRDLPESRRALLRKRNIGFVFQNFNLIEDLTVAENLELPLHYLRIPLPERRNRVQDIMERLEIMPFRDVFPRRLSGGQQQRVAVARAVVTKPRLILADEPTGNLDSTHGDEVMQLLADLNRNGTAIVMVTHSPAYARYGHRIIHLFDGRIVSENIREKGYV
ncbi:MAG: ABC transporter ATP-binding protein [Candidatus Latescibacterota bacterium]